MNKLRADREQERKDFKTRKNERESRKNCANT